MKILALMTVKNEDDILKDAIDDAIQWADYIVIMDNGSTDNSFNIIQDAVVKYDNVFFWGIYGGPFHDWIRSLMFNDYKHLINENDWVCRLDADEFYIDNPKQFLEKISIDKDMVYSVSFQYYFSDKDLETDSSLPAQKRMKYYNCNHSESRFIRIKKDTFWPITRSWPIGLDHIADQRIRLKHFQYRTEEQMNKRMSVRDVVNQSNLNANLFIHEHRNNKVFNHLDLTYDDGTYTYDLNKLPRKKELNFINKYVLHPLITKFFGIKRVQQILYPPTFRKKI